MLKILLYTLIILYGGIALFAFRLVKKTITKYRNIKEVGPSNGWEGAIRKDFNKWNQKAMIRGSLLFPIRLISPLVIVLGITFINNFQKLLSIFHKSVDLLFAKYIARPSLNLAFNVIQQNPIQKINTPILISNHVCWFDALYLATRFYPISFVSKKEIEGAPIVGKAAQHIQCIFVDRKQGVARQQTLQKIKKRVEDFNSKQKINPLIIFPEGTTSNGASILKFKIGAFHEKASITIASLNYSCQGFEMGMDEILPLEHFIISLCLRPRLRVKFEQVHAKDTQTPQQYMQRCQLLLSNMTGYQIYSSGIAQKTKLKQQRFGIKID